MKKLILIIAALTCSSAFANDPMENSKLYEQCKAYQHRDGKFSSASNTAELINMMSCLNYMMGSLHAYNMALYTQPQHKSCKFEATSVNDFIEDYLKFSKKTDSMATDRRVVVNSLVEECYCKEEPAPFCPR